MSNKYPHFSLTELREQIAKIGFEPFAKEVSPGVWKIGKSPGALYTNLAGKEQAEKMLRETMAKEAEKYKQ